MVAEPGVVQSQHRRLIGAGEGGKVAVTLQSQRLGPFFSQQPAINRRLCDL